MIIEDIIMCLNKVNFQTYKIIYKFIIKMFLNKFQINLI